jgi:predicted Fe-Mo cluster-binding NifX family protein
MKIAITASGPTLDDQVEVRFGRAPYYLFVDSETMEYEAVQNPNVAAGGGAGIQSAQLMSDHGVKAVLTGNCGPNAFQVFGAAGIEVIIGVTGIARQVVEQFKSGSFSAAARPNVESHFGMGGGMGKGGGRGIGKGSGMGMGGGSGTGAGRGMGMAGMLENYVTQPGGAAEADKNSLKEKALMLKKELKDIERMIDEIDRKKGV